jgi:hypothetical protein
MTPKARRLPDWVADIREALRNIESDIGDAQAGCRTQHPA